jgi:hypothetical protein
VAEDAIWLLVDTQKKIIQVRQGETTLASFAKLKLILIKNRAHPV